MSPPSRRAAGAGWTPSPQAALVHAELEVAADPVHAVKLRGYFKTGPGEYAEGDRFLGLTTPRLRALAREHRELPLEHALELLSSPWHEARLLALLLLVERHRKGDPHEREAVHRAYLARTDRVNNWDLVDSSAEEIVGAHLEEGDRSRLLELARSPSLWERRIAVIATLRFIRKGDFSDTFRVADALLGDSHDLIHKAVGWMLREVGKRDREALEAFLASRYRRMPRTMLRYAIERFEAPLRGRYLRGEV